MTVAAISYAVAMSDRPTVHENQIAEARNVLGEVIARARFAGEPTILINRGKKAAVIVSYDDYATLRELRAYLEELEADDRTHQQQSARVLRESLAVAKRRALDST